MDNRNELIKKEIIERCNMGIVSLTIVDVIAILLLLVVISAKNIIAILSISVLVIVITLIILYFKKVKKNPLKYRKYFYNLKSANINNEKSNTIEYNLGYDFKSNLFGEKISVRCEGDNISERYVQRCKDFFCKMNENEINNLVNLALNDYKEFKEIAEPVSDLPMDNRILKYINPQIMWISGDKNDNDEIEFLLECECEWNGEEIEIIVANNKIIHVGQYDGDIGYWKKKEI